MHLDVPLNDEDDEEDEDDECCPGKDEEAANSACNSERMMATIMKKGERFVAFQLSSPNLGIHPCLDDEWIDDMEQRHCQLY